MNSIYRSIWNDKTGTFVATSEIAKSHGKKSSSGATALVQGACFALKGLAVSLMLAFGANVYALPTGGTVTAGSASIATGAGAMTISQTSQNAALNWQSFNIGQTEAVRFAQPNSSSVALNRVLGSDPSSILGSLSANGKVFLFNPNGMLFGKGASVNVGGLVASTLNITDGDFMAGAYKFSGAGNGAILNQGTINADGGFVALLGANISNQGVISARLGSVTLAAGNAMTLDIAGDGLLNVTVNQGAVNALVHNGGMIQADGGQVLLTAQAAGSLLQSAVNNTGVIQAQTIANHNGTIRLMGDMQSGTVNVSGTVDASGTGARETGGNVLVTGHHVGLMDQAKINASGDAGGGSVLVGGDYQGKNPNIQNASATYMSADATITVDAITNGNGGKAVLWSNEATRAYGGISARGGAQGGDGGLIETSGHWLDVAGIRINARAPSGKSGAWLLDPYNITIQAAGADTNVTASPNFTSTNDDAIVTTASIEAALNGGTSVIVTTGAGGAQAGNITVASTLAWNHAAMPTLTLTALGNVTISSAITATTGSFAATAGGDITIDAATKSTTGNLTFTAANDVKINAPLTVTTGNITAKAGHDVIVPSGSAITLGTGEMVLHGDNDGTGPGASGGTVTIGCGVGCITHTVGGHTLSIRFNPVSYGTTAAEIAGYISNLTGAATLDAKAWVFINNSSATAQNKTYDGTTAATLTGSFAFKSGPLNVPPAPDGTTVGQRVSLSAGTGTFNSKDVAAATTVAFTGYGLGGADVASYSLFSQPASQSANITTKALTMSGLSVPASKIYDGNATAVVSGGPGSLAAAEAPGAGTTVDGKPYTGDTVSITGTATGTYNSKNVGTATTVTYGGLSLTGAQNTNYSLTIQTPAARTITQAPLTISAVTDSRAYNGLTSSSLTPTVTAGTVFGGDTLSVLTQSFASKNVLGTNGSTLNVNSYTLTDGNSGANYDVTLNSVLGTITPITLSAAIIGPPSKEYDGGTAATLTAANYNLSGFISGEGATVSQTVGSYNSKNVATASSVTANLVAGNFAATGATLLSNYTLPASATGAGSITAVALDITANSSSKLYGTTLSFTGSEFTSIGLKSGEAIGSINLASAGALSTATVGSYAITAGGAVANGAFVPSNYNITYVPGNLNVTAALLLGIAANSITKTYDGLAFSGGNGVTYSGFQGGDTVANSVTGTLTYDGTSQGAVNVGSYTIVPGGQTSTNYTINYVNGTLGVIRAPLGIAANSATRIYGDANPAFSATYSGFKNGETPAVLTGTLAFATPAISTSNVGNYAITPSGQSASNYSITYVNGNLGVTRAALGIAANSSSKLFGDTVSFTGSEFTSTGLKNGETIGSVSLASAGAVSTANVAGSPYAITASAATGGTFNPGNYTIGYVNGSLGVIAEGLAIAANPAVKTYDGLGYSGGNGVVYTGFQGSDTTASLTGTLTYGGSSQGAVDVGNYAIIPSGQTSSNYTITYINSTLGVIPAPLGIAANSASKTYGTTANFSGSEFSSTGLKNGETVGSVSLASAGAIPTAGVAGSLYAITASAASGGTFTASNYTIDYVDGTLGVIPAPLGIAANSATRLYGDANPAFTATYTDFQNGETASSLTGTLAFATPAVATSNVGRYAIEPSGQSSPNYTIAYFDGALGVIPAPLGITADSTSKPYGSTVSFTGSEFSSTGLKNSETVGNVSLASVGGAPTAGVAGSPYAITASNATGGTFTPSNYAIGYGNGLLTVTPIALTVTAGNVSKFYGQTPTLTAFSTAGLVNGETVGSVTETSPGTPATASVAGSPYAITPSNVTGGTFTPSNYTISYVNGLLTVTPIGLTVTASDAVKTFGQTPILTAFTTTGLLNGDTVGSVTETSPGTAADASVVGSPYPITPSNATGGTFTPANYTITYVNGELTVMPLIKPVPETVPTLPPLVAPRLLPTVVLAETPAQLLSVVPAAVPERTRAIVVEPAPVVVPAPEAPKVYVAPLHPRKADRN